MSLDPSPLSPQPTPLLSPTDPVPGRGSALIGAGVSVALAIVIVFVTLRFGINLVFVPQGYNAKAQQMVFSTAKIQGFSYYWTGSFGNKGYTDQTAAQNIFSDEAKNYHMNLATITITANQTLDSGLGVTFAADTDTYPDATYTALVAAARAAGLSPIFRLDVRVLGNSSHDPSSTNIGSTWLLSDSTTVASERAWFDSYTAFAVHYAQLAQSLNIPLIIIGSDLTSIAIDTSATGLTTKSKAGLGGDAGVLCYGRRDCEWRHVIAAMHAATYTPLTSKTARPGGTYTGKLTFASVVATSADNLIPEWSTITWWDALDIIGIDAYFPLTNGQDIAPSVLATAWNGTLDPAARASGNSGEPIFTDLRNFSSKFKRNILFTGAGYESFGGSNGAPNNTSNTSDTSDQTEQAYDMKALLQIFSAQTWWIGAIWFADYPVWPRSSLSTLNTFDANGDAPLTERDWIYNTEWAGDCLQSQGCSNPEKDAGVYLREFYKKAPLTDDIWATL
jgi:hypothetical protein